jgi:hypothetical protein
VLCFALIGNILAHNSQLFSDQLLPYRREPSRDGRVHLGGGHRGGVGLASFGRSERKITKERGVRVPTCVVV